MKERLLLKNETIPIIPSHVRFEYNEVRKEWVLLAPERALYPDPIAIEVLKKCDGKISIQLIGENLANLHDSGIIHGDLTTSNIILEKETSKGIDEKQLPSI